MKNIFLVALIAALGFAGCSDEKINEGDPILKENNMKIIPEEPTSKDEIKLIVFNDCDYNTLSGVKRTGKTIEVEKQFNSTMMRPCIQRNDTIRIGKLPMGVYSVNYKLVDTANPATPKIAQSLVFNLAVSK